jgi:hypothetical protein
MTRYGLATLGDMLLWIVLTAYAASERDRESFLCEVCVWAWDECGMVGN